MQRWFLVRGHFTGLAANERNADPLAEEASPFDPDEVFKVARFAARISLDGRLDRAAAKEGSRASVAKPTVQSDAVACATFAPI